VESIISFWVYQGNGPLLLITNSGGLAGNLQGIPGTFSAAINLLKSFGFKTRDEHMPKNSLTV
jgi:hypothetical protein